MISASLYLSIREELLKSAKAKVKHCKVWRGNSNFRLIGEGFCRSRMSENLEKAAEFRRLIMRLDTEFFGGAK